MKKGTKLYSIWHKKCPRCHEGDLFKNRSVFPLSEFDKIHRYCPVCGENFEPEQGFYWGAMYVNYALSVAIALPVFLVGYFLFGMGFLGAVFFVIGMLLLFLPYTFRLGRSIWINFFVNYRKDAVAYNKARYQAYLKEQGRSEG